MTRKESYLTNRDLENVSYPNLIEKRNIYNDFFESTTDLMKKARRRGQYPVSEDLRIMAQIMLNTVSKIDANIMSAEKKLTK